MLNRYEMSLGGVGFRFKGAPLAVDALTATFLAPDDAPVVERIECTLRVGDIDSISGDCSIVAESRAGSVSIRTSGTETVLRKASSGFRANARVARGVAPASHLLPSLAAWVLRESGGLCLHAAGVILDGRAVLFVGPSGAGKTTAALQCGGANCFTWDRASVGYTPKGLWAFALPGGSGKSQRAGLGTQRALPLAAILTVMKGSEVRVCELTAAEKLAVVRENITTTPGGVEHELATLDAAQRLCRSIPIARVETVLDRDVAAPIRQWLGSPECR
jgi:hypothetical protein